MLLRWKDHILPRDQGYHFMGKNQKTIDCIQINTHTARSVNTEKMNAQSPRMPLLPKGSPMRRVTESEVKNLIRLEKLSLNKGDWAP